MGRGLPTAFRSQLTLPKDVPAGTLLLAPFGQECSHPFEGSKSLDVCVPSESLVIVQLPGIPSSGYMWTVHLAPGAYRELAPLTWKSTDGEALYGGDVLFNYLLPAPEVGSSSVRFTYGSPFKPGEETVVTFDLTLTAQ